MSKNLLAILKNRTEEIKKIFSELHKFCEDEEFSTYAAVISNYTMRAIAACGLNPELDEYLAQNPASERILSDEYSPLFSIIFINSKIDSEKARVKELATQIGDRLEIFRNSEFTDATEELSDDLRKSSSEEFMLQIMQLAVNHWAFKRINKLVIDYPHEISVRALADIGEQVESEIVGKTKVSISDRVETCIAFDINSLRQQMLLVLGSYRVGIEKEIEFRQKSADSNSAEIFWDLLKITISTSREIVYLAEGCTFREFTSLFSFFLSKFLYEVGIYTDSDIANKQLSIFPETTSVVSIFLSARADVSKSETVEAYSDKIAVLVNSAKDELLQSKIVSLEDEQKQIIFAQILGFCIFTIIADWCANWIIQYKEKNLGQEYNFEQLWQKILTRMPKKRLGTNVILNGLAFDLLDVMKLTKSIIEDK